MAFHVEDSMVCCMHQHEKVQPRKHGKVEIAPPFSSWPGAKGESARKCDRLGIVRLIPTTRGLERIGGV